MISLIFNTHTLGQRRNERCRLAFMIAVACVGLAAPSAWATRNPKTVSLNGGTVWNAAPIGCTSCKASDGTAATVCPGATITMAYKVTTSGSGSANDWESTVWQAEGSSAVCANTANHTTSGTYTETFNITAPSSPGTYNLTLIAEDGDVCAGGSDGIIDLADAIIVLSPLQAPCCTPTAANDITCDGIDDDCDGTADEDAGNCILCGDAVDACIYIMLDRTGSMAAQGLLDERNALKDMVDFFAGVAVPPPIAVGAFGCNGSGFPANGSGHLGYCTGNADDACTRQALSNTESPSPYGDDDGSTSDGDHYAFIDHSTASQSSTGTHFACALDVVNTELGHGSCPAGKQKILIYATDGGDQDPQASTQAAVDHLRNVHGIEIFVILFPSAAGITPTDVARAQLVASTPLATHYYQAPTSGDLAAIFNVIAEQIGCDDGNPCTADSCSQNGVCVYTPVAAGASCEVDGNLCTIDACNGSGSCVTTGNVACQGSSGTCSGGMTCNPSTGACENLPAPPAGTTCDRDSNLCTIDECNGTGDCVFVSNVSCSGSTGPCDSGTQCNPNTGACDALPDPPSNTACEADGNQCTIDHCNGTGSCVFGSNVVCAGSSGPCDGGTVCNSSTGACDNLPDPAAGTSCDLDGNLCTVDLCNGSGSCVFDHDVSCPGSTGTCDAGSVCTPATGACTALPDPAAGTPCEADGSQCTIDECDGTGTCVFDHDVTCPGPTGICDGGTTCTPATGACDPLPDPSTSTSCDADGNLCTVDHCNGSGSCVLDHNLICPGPTGVCDAGTTCNPANGSCVDLPDPAAGTSCDLDASLCTVDECNGTGSCVFDHNVVCPGSTGVCDAGTACTPGTGACDPLPDPPMTTSCEADGNLCTVDHCNGSGSCVLDHNVSCSGPTGVCDSGTQCTPATGACDPLPDPPTTTSCEADGSLCTVDHCNGSGSCVLDHNLSCPGPTGTCDGGTACTPATGACDALPEPASGTTCERDGDLCTQDQCDGSGSCVTFDNVVCPGSTGTCDAGQNCNPATGTCQNNPDPPAGTTCEADGNLCTIEECNGSGNCVFDHNVSCPGPTGTCDGGTTCTPATGACDPLPDPSTSTSCEADGNLCTIDHCDGSGSCVFDHNVSCSGPTGVCDGGTACTPATGACDPLPDPAAGTPCEADGNFCTIDDCDGSGACGFDHNVSCSGPTGVCDGGTSCTPSTGACDPLPDPPSSTSCEADGNLCTIDHCSGSGSCVFDHDVSCPGPTGTCDGGTSCTPSTGACDPLPEPIAGTPCEADGNLCTIDDCDGSGVCGFDHNVTCPGPTGVCDGGTACTPSTGTCDSLPDPSSNTPCEADGNLCTVDHCDGSGSCVFDLDITCPGPTGECDGGTACAPSTGACMPLPDPSAGTSCEADGSLCTIDECNGSGTCILDHVVTCPGPSGECDGGTACTPSTGACDPLPDSSVGTSCERDGDLCTIDQCDGLGNCVQSDFVHCPGPIGQCDNGLACSPNTGVCDLLIPLPSGISCERDGSLCTLDHCDGLGACVSFDEVDCLGPNGPCDGGFSCTPSTGACDPLPDPPFNTDCELDNNECTLDHCDGQGSCVHFDDVVCPGPIGDCDHGTMCNPATGVCDELPDPGSSTTCERDGNLCTLDHCDGAGSCVTFDNVVCPGSTGTCDAGQNCDPTSGSCVNLPDPPFATQCEQDGNLCTLEQCDGGGGCVPFDNVDCPGPDKLCDAGTACTPTTGACDPLPDPPTGTPCERDGNMCTIDRCDGSGSCIKTGFVSCPGSSGTCDAGTVCLPQTGTCNPLPDPPLNTPCELDANQCTLDHCDGFDHCVNFDSVDCIGPTGQCDGGTACNPGTGACDPLADPNVSTPCEDDGDHCTQDHCNGLGDCVLLTQLCGACCEGFTGGCTDDLLADECVGDQRSWFAGRTCDSAIGSGDCQRHRGACCEASGLGFVCTDNLLPEDCEGPDMTWQKGLTCAMSPCERIPIPTVSEWGLVVLSLVLLTGVKIAFGRRPISERI